MTIKPCIGELYSIAINPNYDILLQQVNFPMTWKYKAASNLKLNPDSIEFFADGYDWGFEPSDGTVNCWTLTKRIKKSNCIDDIMFYLSRAISVRVTLDAKGVVLCPLQLETDAPIIKMSKCSITTHTELNEDGLLDFIIQLRHENIDIKIKNFVVSEVKSEFIS